MPLAVITEGTLKTLVSVVGLGLILVLYSTALTANIQQAGFQVVN
jgi:hypothetical protein